MKNISIIVLLFVVNCHSYAQWTNQNIVPEGNNLWSTFFIDDDTGWIVGSDGLILKTTNTGDDWSEQTSGTNETLKSVQFIDQNYGWICGTNGIILLTSDGGNNWSTSFSESNEILNDLFFTDHNTGYIVGNNELILKSIDGGRNWAILQTGSTYDLYSVDFVDSNTGYAVGGRDSSNFLKTTDGGINWVNKALMINYSATPMLNCVDFIDANTGFIGSEGQYFNHSGNISKTTDGGETWSSSLLTRPLSKDEAGIHTQEDSPYDNQRGIRSIWFKDSMNGFAVGGSLDGWWRSIYSTTDGGNSWQKKYGYSEQTGLLSIYLTNNGYGIAVGYRGVIYRTTNSGSSWAQLLSGTQVGYTGDWISSVFMINDSLGWAAGFRKGIWYYPITLKTSNGGKIWETNKEFSNTFSRTSADIFFINELIGWVTFYDMGSYKTTDGGHTWVISTNPGNKKYFKNQDTGWSVYAPSGVFKSTDGGNTWIQKSAVSSKSVYFSDWNNGFAAGDNGKILKSTDGGESWTLKNSGTIGNLNDIHFYDNGNGMSVGANGLALITTNGGENWTASYTGSSAELSSVRFTSAASVWITGAHGTILHSIDSGNNWYSYLEVTSNDLSSVSFINENNGWFAGANGTILKYENYVLPVELTSFEAKVNNEQIYIFWQTATELNNYGFEIERKDAATDWLTLGFIKGSGNSTINKLYTFIDNNPGESKKIYYRLRQLDLNGDFSYSNIIQVDLIPSQFEVLQNFPNPFNPRTIIRYSLAKESDVVMKVFNILGAEVSEIVNDRKVAGNYEVEFNAESLASGIYVYQIKADDFVQSKKMILMR